MRRLMIAALAAVLCNIPAVASAQDRPVVHQGLPGDRAGNVRVNRGPETVILIPDQNATEADAATDAPAPAPSGDPSSRPVRVEDLPRGIPVSPRLRSSYSYRSGSYRYHRARRGYDGYRSGARVRVRIGDDGEITFSTYDRQYRHKRRFAPILLPVPQPASPGGISGAVFGGG